MAKLPKLHFRTQGSLSLNRQRSQRQIPSTACLAVNSLFNLKQLDIALFLHSSPHKQPAFPLSKQASLSSSNNRNLWASCSNPSRLDSSNSHNKRVSWVLNRQVSCNLRPLGRIRSGKACFFHSLPAPHSSIPTRRWVRICLPNRKEVFQRRTRHLLFPLPRRSLRSNLKLSQPSHHWAEMLGLERL